MGAPPAAAATAASRRPAFALVRRRWHGLVWSEPWTSLAIGSSCLAGLEQPEAKARWLEHKRGLLECHARHLYSLTLLGCLRIQACVQPAAPAPDSSTPAAPAAGAGGIDSLLQPLRAAGRLASLHLESTPLLEPQLLHSLRALPALNSLSLDSAQLLPATAAVVRSQPVCTRAAPSTEAQEG